MDSTTAQSQTSPPARSFLAHAKLISLLTFVSRVLGLARESLAAHFFGAEMVSSAFSVAFAIPNLFRRLFGEGAISAAFIPLYSQAVKTEDREQANRFAAQSVKLLLMLLVGVIILGELLILLLWLTLNLKLDGLLALKLTAIMLPYVMLVCGAAFLGGILQVHKHFGLVSASPMILNFFLIGSTLAGAWFWDLRTIGGQTRAIYLVSAGVLVAGVMQVMALLPSLRAVGFRLNWRESCWTPAVKKMLRLTIPVAMGAGVLQVSVLLDRQISFLLSQRYDLAHNLLTHFSFFGHSIPYPMAQGAAARLFWAQLIYQFPLGVFAIALATAIFPQLSTDAHDTDLQKFSASLRQGIKVTLWEGLPASLGLIIVARPAVQVLFQSGRFSANDTYLMAGAVQMYAAAIWAFSIQQIIGRAYYALHDTRTPFVMSIITLLVNLAVEIPLLWTMGEAGMAAGTTVSYAIQAVIMLLMLNKRIRGIGLREICVFTLKVAAATAAMGAGCYAVSLLPFYPKGVAVTRASAGLRLVLLVGTGGGVYCACCAVMGIGVIGHLFPRRPDRRPIT